MKTENIDLNMDDEGCRFPWFIIIINVISAGFRPWETTDRISKQRRKDDY